MHVGVAGGQLLAAGVLVAAVLIDVNRQLRRVFDEAGQALLEQVVTLVGHDQRRPVADPRAARIAAVQRSRVVRCTFRLTRDPFRLSCGYLFPEKRGQHRPVDRTGHHVDGQICCRGGGQNEDHVVAREQQHHNGAGGRRHQQPDKKLDRCAVAASACPAASSRAPTRSAPCTPARRRHRRRQTGRPGTGSARRWQPARRGTTGRRTAVRGTRTDPARGFRRRTATRRRRAVTPGSAPRGVT